MRCLYCGNELALLKKLTGYGEFCSEAHRQKYQEQYNRLALTRLLQAQDSEAERRTPLSRTAVRPSNTLQPGSENRELPQGSPEKAAVVPVARTSAAAKAAPVDPPPPDLSGFVPHVFEPALAPTDTFSPAPFLSPVTACLPNARGSGADGSSPGPTILGNGREAGGLDTPSEPVNKTTRWRTANQTHAVELSLVRSGAAPILAEGATPFDYILKYEGTLQELLQLMAFVAETPKSEATPRVTVEWGEKLNGHGGLGKMTEADAGLYEGVADPLPSRTREPVVINFSALGIIDPAFLEPSTPVAKPASETLTAEAAPASEVVTPAPPPLCTRPAVVPLGLLNDAFKPVDEARYLPPRFEILTPVPATYPLRPKLVFGPSPIVPVTPEQAPEQSVTHTNPEPVAVVTEPTAAEPPSQIAPAEPAAFALKTPQEEEAATLEHFTVTEPKSAAAPVVAERVDSTPESSAPVNPEPPSLETADTQRDSDASELEAIRLELERQSNAAAKASPWPQRVAVVIALLVTLVLCAYLLRQAFAARAEFNPHARLQITGPNLVPQEGGWTVDWAGTNSTHVAGRQIFVLKPTMGLDDYRLEFDAQIQRKGVGWVFRAVNPKNYYAVKIDRIEGGDEARLVLSRTAVINGEETQKAEYPLAVSATPGKVLHIRTDVTGPMFNTYVQQTLVDTWIDDRIKVGGIGLAKDRDEVAQVRSIEVRRIGVAQ